MQSIPLPSPRRALTVALALTSLALSAAAQSTWYVDVHHPGPGQGTPANPYASIQFAIDQPSTQDKDTILVAPGTYVENVHFGAKALAVVSSGGPAVTEIRAAGPGPVVTLATKADLLSHRLEGFTVTGALGPDDAGIQVPLLGFPVVRRVVVRDCAGPGVRNDYDLVLDNSTLTENGIGLKLGNVGVLWFPTRLVVWGNAVETENLSYFGGHPVTHSIIPPIGKVDPTNTVYADPLFWNAPKGDVHLKAGSPAIQLGDDWGAFEFKAAYVPPVNIECMTAPNSAGSGALIDWDGGPSVSGADLVLRVSAAPAGRLGLFYYGPVSTQVPFGDGFGCVGGGTLGVFRLRPLFTDAGGNGQTALDFAAPPIGAGPGAISPGSRWTFQFFYRDPSGPLGSGFNFSNALRVQFTP